MSVRHLAAAAVELASGAVVLTKAAGEAEKIAVAEMTEAMHVMVLAAQQEVGFVLNDVVVVI